MKKIVILLLIFFTQQAKASEFVKFSIGVDLFESKFKNDALNRKISAFENPFNNLKRVSFGATIKPFKNNYLLLTYRTNALINFKEKYETKAGYTVEQSIKTNSLAISHPITKALFPFVVLTDITTTTKIFNTEKTLNDLMYGIGVTYLLNSNNGLSFTYFFPSEKFGTEHSIGISYSYIF